MKILVIGATGTVGTAVSEVLSKDPGTTVANVSRRGSPDAGVIAWHADLEPPPATLSRTQWDVVVNCAAKIEWNLSREEAHHANVRSVLGLRDVVSEKTHLVHLSTVYVDHGLNATVNGLAHRNNYEWSKHVAESIVGDQFGAATILRTPLIVGARVTGQIARFTGLYQILRCALVGLLPVLIADPKARLDIVPVDAVAEIIVRVIESGPAGFPPVVSIGAGMESMPMGDAIALAFRTINEWRAAHGSPPVEQPAMISPDQWDRFFLPFSKREFSERQLRIIDQLSYFRPYFSDLGVHCPGVTVPDVAATLTTATREWCEQHPRVASQTPRRW